MTITLTGLTEQQHKIADLLWSCDTQSQVDQLKAALPKNLRADAETVHQLIIAAVMDEHEDITEDVKQLIQNICS